MTSSKPPSNSSSSFMGSSGSSSRALFAPLGAPCATGGVALAAKAPETFRNWVMTPITTNHDNRMTATSQKDGYGECGGEDMAEEEEGTFKLLSFELNPAADARDRSKESADALYNRVCFLDNRLALRLAAGAFQSARCRQSLGQLQVAVLSNFCRQRHLLVEFGIADGFAMKSDLRLQARGKLWKKAAIQQILKG